MREALALCRRWEAEGKQVVVATLVAVGGSTPRRAGARLLVSSGGQTSGSVSFGCVEADVAAHAREVLETSTPRLAAYGISDEDAFAVGFSCGGTMEVFIEPWNHLADLLGGVPGEAFVGALATVIAGLESGTHGLFDVATGRSTGDLSPALTGALREDASTVVDAEQARLIRHDDAAVFVEPVLPAPRLVVYGAGHAAQALSAAGAAVGFRVTVCDHRPGLLSPESYPEAVDILAGWPDELVPRLALDSRTFVVVLSHNPEIEDLLLPPLLSTDIAYVGVLGSKRTHAARVQRLTDAGLSGEQIARMHAPVGLDIGAVTPEEIAASIVAELVGVRRKRLSIRETARQNPASGTSRELPVTVFEGSR
jgi:xanthine dehydrogenase accessory factor